MPKLKDTPKFDRPREKFLEKGPDALTNSELLAILLGSGIKGTNVKVLSQKIIKKFGDNLASVSVSDLTKISGIGKTKALLIASAFALTKRIFDKQNSLDNLILSAQDAINLVSDLRDKKQEHLVCLYLNARNALLKKEVISVGTLDKSIFHPREVFAPGLEMRAAAVIIVHNHPSGDPTPSQQDKEVAKRTVEAGKLMGINVVDFLIVAKNGSHSILGDIKSIPLTDTAYAAEGFQASLFDLLADANEEYSSIDNSDGNLGKKKDNAPRYIDLFAGCGGLSIGLEKAGFNLELAVEKSAMASETFYHNFISPIEKDKDWEDFCALPLREQAHKKMVVNTLKAVLDDRELIEELKEKNIDLIVGGPPCQGFSMAGRRNPDDARNQLPWQFLEFIERIAPKAVIMENVVGITKNFSKHNVEAPFHQLYLQLQKIGPGYKVQPVKLNTMHFGIPQHRPRMMLLGIRKDIAEKQKLYFTSDIFKSEFDSIDIGIRPQIVPRAFTFGSNMLAAEKAWIDIGGSGYKFDLKHDKYNTPDFSYAKKLRADWSWSPLPDLKSKIEAGISYLKNQTLRKHRDDVVLRFRLYQYLKANGLKIKLLNMISGTSLSQEEKNSLLEKHLEGVAVPAKSPDGTVLAKDKKELKALILRLATKKHTQGPVDLSRPAPTMVTLPDDFVHPEKPRILTVREMARIQSFPDSFEFRGKETTGGSKRRVEVPQYTQVGNAVAPLLAYELGKTFMSILKKNSI